MEYSNAPDWKLIASQEHEQRKQIEMQMESNIDALEEARQALKTATGYNQFLESKFNDSEAKCASQALKLNQAVELLKKAKTILAKRKQEIALLRDENAKLKTALDKKTEILQEEMLQHERTKYKLNSIATPATAPVSALPDLNAKPKVSTETLENYFAHKLLSNPPAGRVGTGYEKSLQEDTDFMAQLLYIDKQFKQTQK